jgi:hypothetical protein
MSAVPSNGWQSGFLQVLPAIKTHAQISFRYLPPEKREDLIQETIASACVAYQRLAAQGKLHLACPSSLANYAVKQARDGRHVGGCQDKAKDPLSKRCQYRHGVRVVSYHRQRLVTRSGSGGVGWMQLTLADRKDPIPETVAFRVDFARWLRTLTRRDRRMITAFIRGDGTFDVAKKFGVTAGRVSQLRRQYERLWAVFQGELATEKAA